MDCIRRDRIYCICCCLGRHGIKAAVVSRVIMGFLGDRDCDPTLIASGAKIGTTKIWDAILVQCLHCFQENLFGNDNALTVAMQNHLIVIGSQNGAIKIYNIATQQLQFKWCYTGHPSSGHTGPVLAVAIEGDMVVSGGKDATIRVWSLTSGKLEHTRKVDGCVFSVAAYGPNLAAAHHGAFAWSFGSNRFFRARGNTNSCICDCKKLQEVEAPSPSENVTARIWDISDIRSWRERPLLFNGISGRVAMSHSVVAIGFGCAVHVLALPSLELRCSLPHDVRAIAIWGVLVATAGVDNMVKVWNAGTGQLLSAFGHGDGEQGYLNAVAIQGFTIVSADSHGIVKVWDGIYGQLRHNVIHEQKHAAYGHVYTVAIA